MALILAVVYGLLFQWDNKYTAALPGNYGYNVVEGDGEQVGFLVDGWEFYPGQLLNPEEFDDGITPEQYTYIGEYPNFSTQLSSPYGVATYRLILENVPEGQVLFLPELLCAGRVYIDGVLVGEQGSVEPYVPRVMDGVYPIPQQEQAEIIIQCANYSHYYSGMYYPPAVGSWGAVCRMLTVRLAVYGLLCFASLAVALSCLGQWLLGRDKLTGWMGFLSLSFALRVCYPFFRSVGIPSVRPFYALEDVCGNGVLLCAVLLAGELAGMARSRYHRRVAVPAAVGLCVFTLVFPILILPYAPVFINAYGLVLLVWKMAAGGYLVFLARHTLCVDGPMGQYLLWAAGWYGLSVAAATATANWFEPIRGAWLEEYGGFALVVGFGVVMMRRGVRLARENQRLTTHLQEEVERKTQEMEKLLTQRRELLANLLHDVKNPLSALRGYAELVRDGNVDLDPETAEYLDALTQRAEMVGDRMNMLQDFSRGERGLFQGERFALKDFLREFYRANRPDMELSGQKFRLELCSGSVVIQGDRERLRMALENLCYNALSFTPEDGTITLSLTKETGYAILSVRDTGPGIAPEDLPHVFERGFTRRWDGSGEGLGLYIVRTVALEHGGTVSVDAQLGKGSVFTLRLPTVEEREKE